MRSSSSLSALVASGLLLLAPGFANAQRLPPLPPPPVSLAVPHPLLPIATSQEPPRDLFQQSARTEERRRIEERRRTVIYSPGVLFGPSFYMPTSYGYAAPPETVPAAIPRGGLRFDTSPGSAQVYVDGFYAGLVVDFGISGRALDLEAGAHRIELRAAGYGTLAFDVSIPAYQTVRYRGDLERLTPAAPAAPPTADLVPAPKPKTMYVIPNCYAGDRPPVRALPQGCDIKQLQTRN